MLVILTLQELSPVGFLSPSTIHEVAREGVLTNWMALGEPVLASRRLAFVMLALPPPLDQGSRHTSTLGQTEVWHSLSQEGKPQLVGGRTN